VTIAMTDARGKVTTVKPRVRVRGKRPRARRG